jgi:hypothetical protein
LQERRSKDPAKQTAPELTGFPLGAYSWLKPNFQLVDTSKKTLTFRPASFIAKYEIT